MAALIWLMTALGIMPGANMPNHASTALAC
jgi:hypothetical protein